MAVSSMTGFARAAGSGGAWRWTFELKTVNAKGLDIRLRMPPPFDRAEGEARRKRSTLDRDYAKSKSEIQRIVSSIAKGLISDDEAASLLGPARLEVARLESELATADFSTNVIELHPVLKIEWL